MSERDEAMAAYMRELQPTLDEYIAALLLAKIAAAAAAAATIDDALAA